MVTKKLKRWDEIKRKKFSSDELKEIERDVEQELLEMDLRAIREMLGLTQEQLAEMVGQAQSEISRLERRADHRLSTLRRIVEALGGELEVMANFGDKRIRLRLAG